MKFNYYIYYTRKVSPLFCLCVDYIFNATTTYNKLLFIFNILGYIRQFINKIKTKQCDLILVVVVVVVVIVAI